MKKKLSGANLKWFAIIAMLIDHSAIALVYPSILVFNQTISMEILYDIMRLIGRLAFPIFVFLIVEGFNHTRNIKKYLLRLGLFALISEIPFNLIISYKAFYPQAQNIFISLFLGVLMLSIIREMQIRWGKKGPYASLFVIIVFALFNEYIHADYGFYGIMMIAIVYLLRYQPRQQVMAIALLGLYQKTAALSAIPIYFYNGRRGKQNKYFFYIFYPAHLLILYFMRNALYG